ncbi:Poly(ADP-ribose) polymerase, catalytic domain-containing protein [Artemisia annua]|uniref:Poly(ADP-ribose) polymerase, catalytic domain-containing protein n=1 Tax=Artemisia annua TaxID=35608 RepID=A0A2U1M9B0_ARTAN|nr:Poly(ADP-ribose) polymerase, catalytic domain-containing protein [Artemisia annua]
MDRIASYEHQASLLEDQVSVVVEDDDIVRANDSDDESVTSYPRFGIFANDELMVDRLEEGNHEYDVLKRSFVGGTRKSGKNINVVGIHKKNYGTSVMDVARLDAFKVYASAVASRNSGEANIRYGWYGGSRDEICEILKHGFRRFSNKTVSYGRGVCLSPANSPIESVKTSVADSDGLRHMLLCRVILGNPETISFGSPNGYPSSPEFDSGVDNLLNPTNYVIWEHNMNTHILPAFIISFKGDPIEGEQANIQAVRIPTSPHMSINGLIRQLTNYLSSSKMASIKKLHQAYSMKKISRPAFIRCLRANAGDDVLRAVVQRIR